MKKQKSCTYLTGPNYLRKSQKVKEEKDRRAKEAEAKQFEKFANYVDRMIGTSPWSVL